MRFPLLKLLAEHFQNDETTSICFSMIYTTCFPFLDNLDGNSSCNGVDKKVLVVDCRSYAAAFGNRVKGGGSECTGMSFILAFDL